MRLLIPLAVPLLLVPTLALAADTPNPTLPLREVALFSSGVGYFGRAGDIDGETNVPLSVYARQIPDLLKSMVLFDPKGGIRQVTYSLQDYLTNRVKETDLQLATNATPGTLLQAFQGSRVRLEKPSGAIEGSILSVSTSLMKVDNSYQNVEQLSLLTSLGVQTIRLDDVQSFRLLDPSLDAKLRATLEKRALSLTQKLDAGTRDVMLHFAGKGKREVRAAYLLETPAWKTSYRLVLEPKKKPYLQGWAVVENTTDEDWRGVHLSLVSGRPISFIQDLVTPVYVARTVVPPQIIGSATPQTFGEGFSPEPPKVADLRNQITTLESRPVPSTRQTPNLTSLSQNINGNQAARNEDLRYAEQHASAIAHGMLYDNDLSAYGAKSEAQGTERGELFEYAIDGGTTLAHGEAAMVPIVSSDIDGEAVSIVDSSLQKGEVVASNGFLLRNSSGLHLQGGPITVFAAGAYAGDALVSNLGPNDSRLIAYARDLELIATQNEPLAQPVITKLAVDNGKLFVKSSAVLTRSWNFKNKGTTTKNVLLQVPDAVGWILADPKQLGEKTADGQRFRLTVAPGEAKYTVKWKQQYEASYVLFDMSSDALAAYLTEGTISPALKTRLSGIIEQRNHLTALAAQRALQEAALKDIVADQDRIRANMEPLDRSGKLFQSYEAKLGAQEDRIEKVRAEITRLREAEDDERAGMKCSLAGLNLE